MEFQEYRSRVIEMAKEKISKEKWYRGVCVDNLKDCFLDKKSVEEAAEILVNDTRYWGCH